MEQAKGTVTRLAERTGLSGKFPIKKPDALAAVTVGIANVPDGMASGVLAGVNPVYGIYTLMIGTPIAALACSTQLMMFNTTSAMTLVATDALGTRTGDDRVQALIVVALIAGIFQLAMGLLGMGMIVKFVSNAVMVGFLTGIAALIIMGQLWDLTGYEGEGGTRLQQTAQLLANLGDVDIPTTIIGVGSIVIMVLLGRTKLASFNLLIALGAAAAVQWIFDFSSVGLVGEIPRDLPSIGIPQLSVMPAMLLAGIATGIVGLLQAAGVAQAFPNPDGSETSDSRDFAGQGIANISTSFFGGMAGGGSLSGTALNVSAGARSRYAAVMQALVVVIIVLVFSDVLSMIPTAALAALLIYAAALSLKFDAIATIRRTSWMSFAAMAATFLATLVVPLQQAVIFGVIVAGMLFIYRSSTDIRLQQLSVSGNQLVVSDPPDQLPDQSVTVLDVEGNLFYAGARTLSEQLPDASSASRPVVVLRLRGESEVGSTFFKVVGKYAEQLRANGGRLILTGVDPRVKERMSRTGNLDLIGAENVLLAGNVLGESTIAGYESGASWLTAALPADNPLEPGAPEALPSSVQSPGIDGPEQAVVDSDRSTLLARIQPLLSRERIGAQAGAWESAAVAGVVMLATGLIGIFAPSVLESIFHGLIGGMLLCVAGFWIYQTLSVDRSAPRLTVYLRMFSAGVAALSGVAMLLAEFIDDMPTSAARLVLAFGLILMGGAGMFAAWDQRARAGTWIGTLSINGLFAALGLLALVGIESSRSFFDQVMRLMVAGGIGLVAFAVLRFRQQTPVQDAAQRGEAD